MEKLIAKIGHFIQVVTDSEGHFAYTFGRNDKDKSDLIMLDFSATVARLFEEATDLIDLGEPDTMVPYTPGKIYESKNINSCKYPGQPVKFKIVLADPADHRDKILGVLNRSKDIADIKLLEIVVVDGDNNLL
jgi:hypothetical protein